MPTMPRSKREKKATKIAFNILGTPANLLFKRSKQQKKINQRLTWEETFRVR